MNMVHVPVDIFLLASAIVSLSFTILYFFFRKQYQLWKKLGVQGPEPQMLYGNTGELVKLKITEPELNDVFYKQYSKEDYIGYYNMWQPILLVRDLSLVKRIMEKDFDHFTDRRGLGEVFVKTDSIFINIFSLKGDAWKSRRTWFTKLFTPKKLKQYFDDMHCSLSCLMEDMKDKVNQDLEIATLIKKHAIRTICMQLYGLDVSQDKERIAKFMDYSNIFTSPPPSVVLKIMGSTKAPWLFKFLKVGILPTNIYKYFADLTYQLMSGRAKGNMERNDFLDIIMKMMDEGITNNEKLKFDEAVGHVFSFFLASYDTTVLTICHIFLQLALNSEIQEKARQEVCSMLNGSSTMLYDHINEMNYLDAIICETLRIFPTVGIINRVCTKSYKVNNKLTIPKGMNVNIPVASLQMDPKYYPEPEKFNPERFYNKYESNKDVWLPFGTGPKVCLGMRLAKITIKAVLAKTLMEYVILPSENMALPMKFDPKTLIFTVKPIKGFWIKLQKRDHSD